MVPARSVQVAPERLRQWIDGFALRHGGMQCDATALALTLTGGDGARAVCSAPFPPLLDGGLEPTAALVAQALRERTVGVLLVRLGGHAAGVFVGTLLHDSKVGTRLVHGRSAAGGQSQQRFARRREGQARVALEAAADIAARVLLPQAAELDAVVLGGDRRAAATVLADLRLTPLLPLVVDRWLDVPDPRRRVLLATPALFRAVRITVYESAAPPAVLG